MIEMRIRDQTIRYDRDATAAVYASLEHSGAEECGCIFCDNFIDQRNQIYPESFRGLLEQLGVDPDKEGEVFEYGPVEDGCHLYDGWFYFVGEMVTAGERNYSAPDSHHFGSFFTTTHPSAPAFRGGPMLAIQFTNHAKWVFLESPDSGRRPAIPHK